MAQMIGPVKKFHQVWPMLPVIFGLSEDIDGDLVFVEFIDRKSSRNNRRFYFTQSELLAFQAWLLTTTPPDLFDMKTAQKVFVHGAISSTGGERLVHLYKKGTNTIRNVLFGIEDIERFLKLFEKEEK